MQGFRTFSNQAAMSAAKQNHLIDSVWRDLCPRSTDDFTRILEMHHKHITQHTFRPFLYTSEQSTNLSFIHLVAQSLVDEHVCFAAIYYITNCIAWIEFAKRLKLHCSFPTGILHRTKGKTTATERVMWRWVGTWSQTCLGQVDRLQ